MAETYTMSQLLDRIGLEYTGRNNLDCPFCGKKKKLHFDANSNLWKCPVCKASGGVLHFYARYQLGMEQLPYSKSDRGELAKQLREFMGDTNIASPGYKPAHKAPAKPTVVPVADDITLHTVYAAMAALPVFQLLPEHKKELNRRGLTNEQIVRNGYRTFPVRTSIPKEIVEMYNSVPCDIRKGVSEKKAAHIQLGLYVANCLEREGHDLQGIPGFYKFGPYWCLTYSPGILIPTRNINGQIVIWQVRRKFEPKYLTLSCGSLPGAVTDTVSRCHFPLGNSPLSDIYRVIFTEGPLKADVTCALSHVPAFYVAIPGINTTKDLFSQTDMFKKGGVTQLYNGLDMDKLTNPHVRSGSKEIAETFRKSGLEVIPMYWGEEYATQKLAVYRVVAKAHHLSLSHIPTDIPVFDQLNLTAKVLNDAGFDPGKTESVQCYWEPETKGIDDYYFSLKK